MDNLPGWIQTALAVLAAFMSAIVGAVVASWRAAATLADLRRHIDNEVAATRHGMRNELQREVTISETATQKLEERVRQNERDIAVLQSRRPRQ